MRYSPGVAAMLATICVIAAPPATAGPLVPQGKIDSLLLSDDDVSSIVGLPMRRFGNVYPSPAASSALPDRDDCRSFVQSDVTLWTGEFTAFRQVNHRDNPDNPQFATTQVVAAYPNPLVAAGTFRRGFAPAMVGRCNSVTVNDSAGASWRLDGITITGDHASWKISNLVNGQDTTWRCANDARQKGNVMFQEVECQFGNGGPLVAQMTNTVADRFP